MVIDAHVHLYPPPINADPAGWAAAHGEEHWAVLATRVRKSGVPVQGFPSVDELLRDLDAAGIDRAVLLGWYWRRPESCAEQNRFFAGCVRDHPDRLAACATIFPPAGIAHVAEELARAREAGFQGLGELSPHSQHYPVDDPAFEAALLQAGAWNWPVNLHVTDPQTRAYPGRVETPWADFEALATKFPKTTLILAHLAGGVAVPLQPNLYVDTAALPVSYAQETWPGLVRRLPADRVIFGSDYPLRLYPQETGLRRFREEVAGATGDSAAVLGANAAKWFGVPGCGRGR